MFYLILTIFTLLVSIIFSIAKLTLLSNSKSDNSKKPTKPTPLVKNFCYPHMISEKEGCNSIMPSSDPNLNNLDGDVSENAGFQDYWIVKVDNQGIIQWEKSFGFIGQDQAYKVIPTTDGGYFASGTLQVGEGGSNGEGNDIVNEDQNLRSGQHSLGDFWGIKMDANLRACVLLL